MVDPATTTALIFAGKCVGGAVIAVGGASVALPVMGFTSAGIGAETIAAGIQSMIGNVAAGSAFAALQSAGVVGLAASTKAAIGSVGAVALALLPFGL